MKPVLAIVVITAIQEDIILTAVAMKITVQENLPFFKKSVGGGGKQTKDSVHIQMHGNNQILFGVSSLSMSVDTFPRKKISTINGL